MTKRYEKLIGLSKLPLEIVPTNVRDLTQELDQLLLSDDDFSPSIVDIDTIFYNFANINRDENEPLVPWSVYDDFFPLNRDE